jgi:hypothetical protein
MASIRRRPVIASSQSEPLTRDTPLPLLPTLLELRKANGTMDVLRIFKQEIPETLWSKMLVEMLRRPAMFREETIRDALRLVGFSAVAKELGVTPAGVAFNRFVPSVVVSS